MSHLPIDTYRPRCVTSRSKILSVLMPALALLMAFGASAAKAQGTFTLSNNGPITAPYNTYTSLTVTITPVGGFTGSVLLVCTNMPIYASCKFPNLDQVVPVSGAPASITFTVNTSQVDQYESKTTPQHRQMERVALCTLFAPGLALMLFVRRKGARCVGLHRLMMCVVVLLPLAALGGCAAVTPQGTPVGTYTFVVTGNAGPQTIPTTVTLKVT